ncbi:tetratricopeptide repeat protein [Streptomyces platensis]|uniref:tetratricopeptide repeat protein n=1 Tax=Streptomyces platensis TaxID=58346 RepID=UPI002E800A35|nr:tetratricopeptide repeat protein [Streptomyces platensis]WUB81643.1 tetratricopeptide repeat protein [Streptomyces platensis]
MVLQVRAEHATVLPTDASLPVAELAAPPGLINLPPPSGRFVGRAHALDRLDAMLERPGGVVVQAVHGLGGIGKSTLAAHWAATRATDHYPIWWITADSPAALDQGLAALATALQPALSGVLPLEALRERAVAWLAAHDGWLVILDNVSDPADVLPLLERTRGGRFLVTSRRATGWHYLATPVPVDVLDQAEAVDLLTRILHRTPAGLDGADELCAELGRLPLAVEQAGAYIAESGITPRAYLDLLAAHPATMYRHGAEGTDPNRTIARIWHVTLDRLMDDPLTGTVLRTLAWYAPDHIPRHLLDGLAEPPELARAVGRLAAYGLLTVHPDTATVSMHRLLQAVARTPDRGDPHRQSHYINDALSHATAQLHNALPDHWNAPTHWPAWRTLLPHIDALTDHTPPDTDTDITADLLNRTGLFLDNQGNVSRAIRYLQRAVTDAQRVLGEDHPYTLNSRNGLAAAYRSAGDLQRAVPLFEQTLTDRVRVLGDDHPDILTSRNNLAAAYQSAGDLQRAVPLLEQNLIDAQRVLGEDHPDTLSSRNNLAYAYRSAGDLVRAVPLFEQTLTDRVRVLGEDHPDTLTSRNNLAGAYQSTGDLQRAVPLLEQNLIDAQRVLGEDHPYTLTSRNNLAYAYRSEGDLQRAVPLYEQNLIDAQRVLGDDHPDTLSARNNLAGAYRSAGDLQRAVPLFEQTLTDRVRVLGDDHPDTLSARNNLADAYRSEGDLQRAVSLLEQNLIDAQRVLGDDHSDTLSARNNLAGAYRSAGDLQRAVPLLEQTLTDAQRVLGEDHPLTAVVRSNLAAFRRVTTDRET